MAGCLTLPCQLEHLALKVASNGGPSVVAGAALMGSLVDFQSQHYDSPSVLPVTLLPVCSREAVACLSKDRQWERDKECSSTLHSVNTCCRCFVRQILVMFWFKVLMLSQGPAATIG